MFNNKEKEKKAAELIAKRNAEMQRKAELEANHNMLMEQWNIANSIKDEAKRLKHTAKISYWIEKVEAELYYSNTRLSEAV
jgi:hypothetical protein